MEEQTEVVVDGWVVSISCHSGQKSMSQIYNFTAEQVFVVFYTVQIVVI